MNLALFLSVLLVALPLVWSLSGCSSGSRSGSPISSNERRTLARHKQLLDQDKVLRNLEDANNRLTTTVSVKVYYTRDYKNSIWWAASPQSEVRCHFVNVKSQCVRALSGVNVHIP